MADFPVSLVRIAAVVAAAAAAGWLASPAVCPRDPVYRGERIAWSWAIGAALTAAMVPLAFLLRIVPGWPAFLVLAAGAAAAGRLLPVKEAPAPSVPAESDRARVVPLLVGLALLGFLPSLLRSLTEPMWANDFVAIWGLKGKTIHAAATVPPHLLEDPGFGFSHPEYPIGLPFLYAGVSFLTGGWDDHALALLFPVFQLATLAALFGWLRRHGAARGVAWAAVALLSCFEPLYSAFLTGMAEVPLSLGLLLFGAALGDALEGEPGAYRRLAVASALITATKNEGLFFAAAGCAIALLFGGERRGKAAFAALPTALLVQGLHMLWRGALPLRDFDLAAFSLAAAGSAIAAAVRLPGPLGWAELVLVAALVVLGRRMPEASWMLGLCACGLAAYVLLPAFAVRGPEWLIQTSLSRTSAGLAPLAAGAIAVRFRRVMA